MKTDAEKLEARKNAVSLIAAEKRGEIRPNPVRYAIMGIILFFIGRFVGDFSAVRSIVFALTVIVFSILFDYGIHYYKKSKNKTEE